MWTATIILPVEDLLVVSSRFWGHAQQRCAGQSISWSWSWAPDTGERDWMRSQQVVYQLLLTVPTIMHTHQRYLSSHNSQWRTLIAAPRHSVKWELAKQCFISAGTHGNSVPLLFSARCTMQSAVLWSHVVSLSVCLWRWWIMITSTYSQEDMEKFWGD